MTDRKKSAGPAPRCEILLIGHLGCDPSLVRTGTGTAITKFSVANNTHKKGHPRNKLIWRQCTAFKELAEYIAENYRKGDLIHIKKATPDIEEWKNRYGEMQTQEKWCVWEISENADAVADTAYGEPGSDDFEPDTDIPF